MDDKTKLAFTRLDGTLLSISSFLLGAGLFWVVGGSVGSQVGREAGIHWHKVEAVESGHGQWIPQSDGTTTFEWKD